MEMTLRGMVRRAGLAAACILLAAPLEVSCLQQNTLDREADGRASALSTLKHAFEKVGKRLHRDVTTVAPWTLEPRPWQEARELAANVSKQLTLEEQTNLMRGSHSYKRGWYVGNTEPIKRFGIPALKMQDAGAGFRTFPGLMGMPGTTTMWPSLLALSSSWNTTLVEEVAHAMGREFRAKGANVMLGPSVNVQRTTTGGRNFEYLSGEDPYLGASLAGPFVRGVQAEGVMACAKHYAFNEQERNRMSVSAGVDMQTAWELYYPPFEAAVKAGVVSVMCAYNKVNGTYACEHEGILDRDLKGEMGFQGFVMSDWGATHTTKSVEKGLDQEMPGDKLFDTSALHNDVSAAAREEAVIRILTAIYRMRLDQAQSCVPPACIQELKQSTSSAAHKALAFKAAAGSAILLKNDGILPLDLSKLQTLALIGPAVNSGASIGIGVQADYYSGGGSGHVPTNELTTPLEAIQKRAGEANITILIPTGNSVQATADVVQRADVVVVVGATTSAEGEDRKDLHLDDGVDELIASVAARKPTVVLMQTPGAVLTPWRQNVSAIANLFLAGEETSRVWSGLLFGDFSPEGKLPIQLPATASDTIPSEPSEQLPYIEQLMTSYRSPKLKAAFPFGHGLSYTEFNYSALQQVDNCTASCCVHFMVTNVGKRPGSEVAQAYLLLKPHTNGARAVLRGFRKTRLLQPGESEDIRLAFSERDVSNYQLGKGWVPLTGGVALSVGSSSEDIRRSAEIQCA